MYKKILISVLLGAVLISACGGQSEAPPASEPVVEDVQTVVEQAAPVEDAAPAEPVTEAPQAEAPAPAVDAGMMAYTSPEELFNLEVPNGWSFSEDTEVIENAIVQTYTAPDGNAMVQVLINEEAPNMNHVVKREVTMDYVRRLYGENLRVSTDVVLPDGRERLVWANENKETVGTTFTDTTEFQMFFYTTMVDEDFKKDYDDILEDVNNSYSKG